MKRGFADFLGDADCLIEASMPPSATESTNYGGERGIRTLVRVSPKHAFQACAFNHSAISPNKNFEPKLKKLRVQFDCTRSFRISRGLNLLLYRLAAGAAAARAGAAAGAAAATRTLL